MRTPSRFSPLSPGVWGILATPFYGDDLAVDVDSLRTLVHHYRQVGARGVVALGVLGEAARLDADERRIVLSTVVDTAGDMPVVAGNAATAAAPAIEEARRAADCGVSAAMIMVNSADPQQLVEHLDRISTATGLGIVLQDHPAVSGIVISPASLVGAVAASDSVVAVKAESPPTAPMVAALAAVSSVPVFGGLGGVGLLDELLAGSAGAMTGFAFPEALVATMDAWMQHGYKAARDQYAPWLPLVMCEAQEKISLAVRKEILGRRGLIREARVRPPGVGLPAATYAALDAHLQDGPATHWLAARS